MDEIKTLEMLEKEALINALSKKMTAKETAKALGVSRATFYRLMKKHGLVREALNG